MNPDEIEAARRRLRRRAGVLRFDGNTIEIELDPAAMIADVSARERAPRACHNAAMTEETDAARTEETVSVVVKLSPIVAELLAVLDLDVAHLPRTQHAPGKLREAIPLATTLEQRCARVLLQLADHAQQGVYRNGTWERQWLVQAFGDGWLERTEPGDPYGRPDDEGRGSSLFRRPKNTHA